MRLIDADTIGYKSILMDDTQIVFKDIVFKDEIDALPTVDAVPVVHGRWVGLKSKIGLYSCSRCEHMILRTVYRYCPYCGAKMDGEVENKQ